MCCCNGVSGESVGHGVSFTCDVVEGTVEHGDGGELSLLSAGTRIRLFREGVY